ncbi:MAG: hypothetical protein ACJ0HH_00105 [Candidatus Thalassarchaeum sp.]
MARLGKAARGKRRWIGIRVSPPVDSRELCQIAIADAIDGIEWKMYDCRSNESSTLAIIRIPLDDCEETTSRLNLSERISTVTRSGKIRLVRQRMGLTQSE